MRQDAVGVMLAVAVFGAGAFVGVLYLGQEPWLLTPVMQAVEHCVRPIAQDKPLLAAFIFFKNLSVVSMALFAEQVVSAADHLRVRLVTALRLPPAVVGLVAVKTARFGRLIPVIVLVVNGAVLAGVCCLLWKSGASTASLAAGLVPHGIPEFSALFLACGAGMYGVTFERKAVMFRQAVVPLLAAAAVIETWVTPEIMRLVG